MSVDNFRGPGDYNFSLGGSRAYSLILAAIISVTLLIGLFIYMLFVSDSDIAKNSFRAENQELRRVNQLLIDKIGKQP